jgi:hypothetical protein
VEQIAGLLNALNQIIQLYMDVLGAVFGLLMELSQIVDQGYAGFFVLHAVRQTEQAPAVRRLQGHLDIIRGMVVQKFTVCIDPVVVYRARGSNVGYSGE